MVRAFVGVLILVGIATSGSAQIPTLPPKNSPGQIQWNVNQPVLPKAVPVPTDQGPLGVPPISAPLDQTGGVAPAFPLPYVNEPVGITPPRPAHGLYGTLEIGLIAPDISGSLIGPVSGGVNRTIGLPFAELDWTGSPRLELGYRFLDNGGGAFLAYRSVVSEAGETVFPFDPAGAGFLETRLNWNNIDLGYSSPEWQIDPLWTLHWQAGIRIAAIYYDSNITGQIISQSASNNFIGAGPMAGIDARRKILPQHGVSVFGKLDGGVVIGGDTQSFEEIRTLTNGTQIGGASRMSETQAAPVFGVQLGLSYQPPQNPEWLRFTFGYQYEQMWNVGAAGASQGDVTFQGLFFRGEFKF